MPDKNWTDQPDEVVHAEIILNTFMELAGSGVGVEVREAPGGKWYLTTGNLFGSQTILARSAKDILILLNIAKQAKKQGVKLPDGCVIMRPGGAKTESNSHLPPASSIPEL